MKRSFLQALLGLVCAAVAVSVACAPRFNQQDLLVGRWTGPVWDAFEYTALVEYLRGEGAAERLTAPFVYRPLVPWLASVLPAEPLTAMNLVNVAAIYLAVIVLFRLQRCCGASPGWSAAGCLLFTFSFPMFYYGTIGLVDPVLVCCVSMAAYSLARERLLWFYLAFIAGLLAKESAVILLPVAVSYLALNPRGTARQVIAHAAALLGIFLILSFLTRVLYPADSPAYVWEPAWNRIAMNATRLKTWASLLLSLGIPGALGLYAATQWKQGWFQCRRAQFIPYVIGIGMSLLLFAYAFVSAYADGRFVWLSHPFALPLATSALSAKTARWRRLAPPAPHIGRLPQSVRTRACRRSVA